MTKVEREAIISELASNIFSQMLSEIVMGSAIQSHQEIARSRTVCEVCHSLCGGVHIPSAPAIQISQASRASTPSSNLADASNLNAHSSKSDGIIFLECVGCSRPIASNRYAPHLSSCMGFGTGSRRTVARSASQVANAKNSSHSQSPMGDILGDAVEEVSKPVKPKGRPKGSTNKRPVPEIESEQNGSSHGSSSSTKIQKKQKVTGLPAPSNQDNDLSSSGNKSGTPALKDHTPAPVQQQGSLPRAGSTDSATSSDNPMASASTPSSNGSLNSPSLPNSSSILRRKKEDILMSQGRIPRKQTSNVALKTNQRPTGVAPVRRMPDIDYHIDVEGEETGSSTDTDS